MKKTPQLQPFLLHKTPTKVGKFRIIRNKFLPNPTNLCVILIKM